VYQTVDQAISDDQLTDDTFQRMAKNMKSIEEFMMPDNVQARIQEIQRQLACVDEFLKRCDDRMALKVKLTYRPHLVEILRVISPGPNGEPSIEQRTYDEMTKQFQESYSQKKHQTRIEALRSYTQIFQQDDAIPQMDVKDVCSNCKGPLENNRKEAKFQCINVNCALSTDYLSTRGNLRVVTSKPTLSSNSPEMKIWKTFLPSLDNHKEGEHVIPDDELDRIDQWLFQHKRLPTGQMLKGRMVNEARGALKLSPLTTGDAQRVADVFNRTPKMTLDQWTELKSRLKFVHNLWCASRSQPVGFSTIDLSSSYLELPHPHFVFHHVCRLRNWPHLQRLYSLPDDLAISSTEQIKWTRFLPFLKKHDLKYTWGDPMPVSVVTVV
jgi:hypothetical protein